MTEEYAESPLRDRLYAIKNVGTGRYVALKGVEQDIYTVSISSNDEARWKVEKDSDKYTLRNREHDTYAAVAGVQANETVKSNPSRSKTSWTITPTPDHATTYNFFIISDKDAYWSLGVNAKVDKDDVAAKIPVKVSVSPENHLWKFVKV